VAGRAKNIITGFEAIDALRGADRIAAGLPSIEAKVSHFAQAASIISPRDLLGNIFSLNAELALLPSEDRPNNFRQPVSDVEVIGEFCLQGTFRYIEEEEIPLDGFAVAIQSPVFIGFDPKKELGFQPSIIELPLEKIYSCSLV
jgi:hypothetical protein